MLKSRSKYILRIISIVAIAVGALLTIIFAFLYGSKTTEVATDYSKSTVLRLDVAGSNNKKSEALDKYVDSMPIRFGNKTDNYTYEMDRNSGLINVFVKQEQENFNEYFNTVQSKRRFLVSYNIESQSENLYQTSFGTFAQVTPADDLIISVFDAQIDYKTKVTDTGADQLLDLWLDKTTFTELVNHYYGNKDIWKYVNANGINDNDPYFKMPSLFDISIAKKMAEIVNSKNGSKTLSDADVLLIAKQMPELSNTFFIASQKVDTTLKDKTDATQIIVKKLNNAPAIAKAINFSAYGLSPSLQYFYEKPAKYETTLLGLAPTNFIIVVCVVALALITVLLFWWYRVIGLVGSMGIATFLAIAYAILNSLGFTFGIGPLLALLFGSLMLLKIFVDQTQNIKEQITSGLNVKEAFKSSIKKTFLKSFDMLVISLIIGLVFTLTATNSSNIFGTSVMIVSATAILVGTIITGIFLWLCFDKTIIMRAFTITGASPSTTVSKFNMKLTKFLDFKSKKMWFIFILITILFILLIDLNFIDGWKYDWSLVPKSNLFILTKSELTNVDGIYLHKVLDLNPSLDNWSMLSANRVHLYIIDFNNIPSKQLDAFIETNAIKDFWISDRGNKLVDAIASKYDLASTTQYSIFSPINDVEKANILKTPEIFAIIYGSIAGYFVLRYQFIFGIVATVTLGLLMLTGWAVLIITQINLNIDLIFTFAIATLFIVQMVIEATSSIKTLVTLKSWSSSEKNSLNSSINALSIKNLLINKKLFILLFISSFTIMLFGNNNVANVLVILFALLLSIIFMHFIFNNLLITSLSIKAKFKNRRVRISKDKIDEQVIKGINS